MAGVFKDLKIKMAWHPVYHFVGPAVCSSVATYLEHVDGDGDEDVEQIPQSQASYENVGTVPHAFVLVDDPQERGIADDSHHKGDAGHHRVHILDRKSTRLISSHL